MFQNLKRRFLSTPTDDVDVRLSEKEIVLIRQTWSVLRDDIANFKFTGADLFIRFFTAFPDYQRQFKSFKDVPLSGGRAEARINKKLLAHGTYVMYTLGMLVDNLENPALLEQMLKRLAHNHYRRRINITAFEKLRDTFLHYLADKLGAQIFTNKVSLAWKKAFGYILTVLDDEFGNLDSNDQKKWFRSGKSNWQKTDGSS